MLLTETVPENQVEFIETPPDFILARISDGHFDDNDAVDLACARRLLNLCELHGENGKEARALIVTALSKIKINI